MRRTAEAALPRLGVVGMILLLGASPATAEDSAAASDSVTVTEENGETIIWAPWAKAKADSARAAAGTTEAAGADSAAAKAAVDSVVADSAVAADADSLPPVPELEFVPVPVEPPTDPLGDYLGELNQRQTDAFTLDPSSVTQAEIDSLIRLFDAKGEDPFANLAPTAGAPTPWARWDWEIASVRYNRVEGINVMPAMTFDFRTAFRWSVEARGGYAWAAEEPTARVELTIPFRPSFAWAAFQARYTRDYYAYGSGGLPGNSLLALTAARDYNDYYLSEGMLLGVGFTNWPFDLDVAYEDERHDSAPVETDFALFEDGSQFRPNPEINEGRMRSLTGVLRIGDENEGRLAGALRFTRGGHEFGGDFDFDRWRGEVVGRQRLWFGDEAKLRVVAGTSGGGIPYQSLHLLGGTRLLRGYGINEFPTREFASAALDYKMGTNLLKWIPWARAFRVQFVPFFDVAAIREVQDLAGNVTKFDDQEWRMAAGLGLQHNVLGIPGGQGQVRLDITRRLDRGDDNMEYRLGLTFER